MSQFPNCRKKWGSCYFRPRCFCICERVIDSLEQFSTPLKKQNDLIIQIFLKSHKSENNIVVGFNLNHQCFFLSLLLIFINLWPPRSQAGNHRYFLLTCHHQRIFLIKEVVLCLKILKVSESQRRLVLTACFVLVTFHIHWNVQWHKIQKNCECCYKKFNLHLWHKCFCILHTCFFCNFVR